MTQFPIWQMSLKRNSFVAKVEKFRYRVVHPTSDDFFIKDGKVVMVRPNKGPFVSLKEQLVVLYNSKKYSVECISNDKPGFESNISKFEFFC